MGQLGHHKVEAASQDRAGHGVESTIFDSEMQWGASMCKVGLNTPKINKSLLYFFFSKIILDNFNYFASLSVGDGTNTYATGSKGFILTGLMFFGQFCH